MGSSLPSKEANLFKLIVKSYETKQYKKGLKAADQILKKFPEHGETLAMKGLTLNCMDRKTEAYDLVRKGLKNDLKSHVCWHVYGLLHRSDREYREAIKCYLNALRIDPDNIQILRDLSLLQAQMRDLGGFVETRRTLLQLKPSHRINWIGFAVAQHLNSSPERAVDILEAFEKTLDENYPPDEERYEHSEMLLYKASLLEESGALETALNELEKKSNKIVDKLGLEEFRASLLWKLGRLVEAEVIYRSLLAINPDNHNYYEGLQKCLNLPWGREKTCSAEEIEALLKLYEKLQEEFPSSLAAKRIPLDFLEGSAFRKAVDNYVRPFLRKGVPSLFSDLRPLYDQPGKADCLEEILTQIESSLHTSGTFPGSSEEEPPSALMWTLFLLAQHYDCRKQHNKALEKIDEAIAHTPTVIDLYLVKGRIHKHGGDMIAAAALADEARSMDLADRFINSESVKRMLQADQVDLAEKTAMLFTKDGNQHSNLYDMQCMWYELASGDSYFRQDSIGKALKKYLAVEKHYADMVEDQFDFHTYCLRKMTLRAYVRLLRFQDRLHSHRFFHRAAASAIRCYLRLYDAPLKTAVEEVTSVEGLPAAERKRLRQKQRKAEARARKEAEEKAKEEEAGSTSSTTKSGRKGAQPSRPVDTDPDGEKLLQVEDPLGEATKYLKLLQDHSSNILETHIFAFELYFRKKKVLLAFQAIKKQLQIDAEDPDVHRCVVKFFHMLERLPSPATESEKLVRNVIELERESLKVGEGKSLLEMNQNFLEKHKDSLRHRAAAAETLLLLSPQHSPEALEIIESSVNNAGKSNGSRADCVGQWILKDCVSVHKLLENTFNNAEAAMRWQQQCSELYPYSTYFRGAKSSVVLGTRSRTTCPTEPNGNTNAGGIGMHTVNCVQIPDFQNLRV